MRPLNYLQSTTGIIWATVCVIAGFALTILGYLIINKVPAKWLCDYNETPSPELLSGKRISYKKSGIFLSVIMSVILVMCRLQFNKGYDIYFILFALIIFTSVMITVSDIKYTIIPDQFTVFLGVISLLVSVYDIARGYNILHKSWWSPIAGAAMGAAVMILIDFLGMIIYKKDGMGFGDVKLFFAIGILTGFPGTIYSLIISLITGAVCFTIILLISKIRAPHKKNTEIEVQLESDTQNFSEESQNNSEGLYIDENKAESSEGKTESENVDASEDGARISGSSQLAFGPYIAISVIMYITLFDSINQLVELYLNLF